MESKVSTTAVFSPTWKPSKTPVEALLSMLSLIAQEKLEILKPEFSEELGYFYPEVLRVAAKYKVHDSDILEELVRMGVLEKQYHESAVLCPKCGSHRVTAKLKCPYCSSERLVKMIVVSHLKCGTINTVERLEGAVCKKCGEPLRTENVALVGTLYSCMDCGSRFEVPHPSFKCRSCGAAFDHKDARLMAIYSYIVKQDQIQSVLRRLMIEQVKELAEKKRLVVETSGSVDGRSGFKHTVDVLVRNGRKQLSLDLVSRSPQAMSEVLSSIAKAHDLIDEHIVFAPEELKNKLDQSQLGKVEGYTDFEDLKKKLEKVLDKLTR